EIELMVAGECPVKAHKHTFFEIVFILEGRGSYIINGQHHAYAKDDIFVIIPEHGHHTIVKEITTFVFIRFSQNGLLEETPAHAAEPEWMHRLEYIFANQHKLSDHQGKQTKTLLRALVSTLVDESERKYRSDPAFISQLIRTLLMVTIREIDDSIVPLVVPGKSAVRSITDYIHSNIREPEKLKIESIAQHVNMSKNYVSEYFRKHSAQSLQQYIHRYKLSLVEERLLASDLTLSEIAFEFGFAGESHLATTFKKHRGHSPAKFRKNAVASVSRNKTAPAN
ncbi:MAG TPA: AraC family transcriptional regulator, partial [Chryseolinea sp.]